MHFSNQHLQLLIKFGIYFNPESFTTLNMIQIVVYYKFSPKNLKNSVARMPMTKNYKLCHNCMQQNHTYKSSMFHIRRLVIFRCKRVLVNRLEL